MGGGFVKDQTAVCLCLSLLSLLLPLLGWYPWPGPHPRPQTYCSAVPRPTSYHEKHLRHDRSHHSNRGTPIMTSFPFTISSFFSSREQKSSFEISMPSVRSLINSSTAHFGTRTKWLIHGTSSHGAVVKVKIESLWWQTLVPQQPNSLNTLTL